ncbi:TOBE domain-containing protein [Uliginosibacterium sp. H3]|uniref:TOBE domain-containing protein n=1 Tax=Uliginosibacterium silvisoli TaxID=3114758 RepID=A0ABU6JXD1_9RHOO|nr:TOBE domain-containing protein [Uliginosibacterium sp. H3]
MVDKSTGRLIGKLEVTTESGSFLGGTRIRLLEAIAEHGSISQAARHVPMSYKAAWDAVDAMNNMAQQALVARTTGGRQGGGTQLTEYGKSVIAMYHAVEREYQQALDRLSQQAGGEAGSVAGFQQLLRRMSLRTSARNQFVCTVCGLREGDVEYEVLLRLNAESTLVAVVTRESVETLGLAIGTEVFALTKASAVALVPRETPPSEQTNLLSGVVTRVHEGEVNSEVVIDLGDGKSLVAVTTRALVSALDVRVGEPAWATFKASNIILSVIG